MLARLRPTVSWALGVAAMVAMTAIWCLQDADHIVTVATGFALAAVSLGKDIVQADKDSDNACKDSDNA